MDGIEIEAIRLGARAIYLGALMPKTVASIGVSDFKEGSP